MNIFLVVKDREAQNGSPCLTRRRATVCRYIIVGFVPAAFYCKSVVGFDKICVFSSCFMFFQIVSCFSSFFMLFQVVSSEVARICDYVHFGTIWNWNGVWTLHLPSAGVRSVFGAHVQNFGTNIYTFRVLFAACVRREKLSGWYCSMLELKSVPWCLQHFKTAVCIFRPFAWHIHPCTCK